MLGLIMPLGWLDAISYAEMVKEMRAMVAKMSTKRLCGLLLIDLIFGRQRVLLLGLGVFQGVALEALDASDQLDLRLFLLNCCEQEGRQGLANVRKFRHQNVTKTSKSCKSKIPSIGGNEFFSSVSACFIVVLSKCSTPLIKLMWAFSSSTASKQKNKNCKFLKTKKSQIVRC